MTIYVALLRAINVGGTGKLAMSELRELCGHLGFNGVATYIQSGNVVFASKLGEAAVKKKLEKALEVKMGKAHAVLLRTGPELAEIAQKLPWKEAPGNRVYVHFLEAPPPKDALEKVVAPGGEELRLFGRELFVHYVNGMGDSKLKVPFAAGGTARNFNTVRKLVEMAGALAAT